MIVTRSSGEQSWIDLNSPTKEEVDSLVLDQNIDPLVAKDLLSPTPKQYAKKYEDLIYAVIHLPSFKHSHPENLEQEIDFIIKEKVLTTTRYDSIDALHHFAKEMEVDQILGPSHGHSFHIFFSMIKEIYSFLFDEIEYMKDWIKIIEKNIFEGKEKEMVFALSRAGRNLLNFKRIVDPHKTVFENIAEIGKESFGERFAKDAETLLDEWTRLNNEVRNLSEMLDELRETNNSILSTKQNEIMKIFTILAFVTFPLSLIAAIFGMNTAHIPIVGALYDFWIVIGIMVMMSVAMFIFFKYKKWI